MQDNKLLILPDNQAISTQKTDKIDFRLPSQMKEMVVVAAQENGQKISQFITSLVENHFEEQAKAIRLAKEAEEQQKRKIEQEYAQLDKKLKHKKSDFRVDEPMIKIPFIPEANLGKKLLIGALVGSGIYFIVRYFLNKAWEKKQTNYTQNWQYNQGSN